MNSSDNAVSLIYGLHTTECIKVLILNHTNLLVICLYAKIHDIRHFYIHMQHNFKKFRSVNEAKAYILE